MVFRRTILAVALCVLVMWFASGSATASSASAAFQGKDEFDRIIAKCATEGWRALPVGELMGKIAIQLEGTPYQSRTLEISPDREICSVNLSGLDCFTFFESTLDLARMLKKGEHATADLLAEVGYTRYRGGVVGDYSTRLHYMSDWLEDNQAKGVVRILSQLPGAEPFHPNVSFMSSHPDLSIQLKAHPQLIPKIKQREETVNRLSMRFVPLARLSEVQPLLKTGDIVAICTDKPGLDIMHTGLVLRTADGIAHFIDASSRKSVMKVTLEPGPLSETIARMAHATGVIFARPLEPK